MSEFDKEAERERLREKYERDEEKRASTQRMSELLLKGATMTNSHCETCGDPIFRYDGQEFCPTCRAGDTGADAAAAETDGAADASGPDAAVAGTDAAEEPADASAAPAEDDAEPAAETRSTPPAVPNRERRPAPRDSGGVPADPSPSGRVDDPTGTERGSTSHGGSNQSLDDVRASLSRTLVRFSQAAEETDDPRRAADLLGAAREAAATLAELEHCRR
jgi:uncharacterized Zn finger protein (UPF0148 family)